MKIEKTKQQRSKEALAIAAGAGIGLAPFGYSKITSNIPISDEKIEKTKKIFQKYAPDFDTFENIEKIANSVIQEQGLDKKGLTLQILSSKSKKGLSFEILPTKKQNRIKKLEAGLNANFSRKQNKIHISRENMFSAVFHEIGHAINSHNKKFMRVIQNLRPIGIIGMPLVAITTLAIGLGHNDKKQNKTTKFIHDNAGKLTFAMFTPVLFEEAVASIKGIKLAKPYLNKMQHQKHIKNLSLAFCSYLIAPAIVAGSVALGLFVKGKIVQHKKPE